MSELTRCNFCNLRDLQREHGKDAVKLVPEGRWLRVYVNDERQGILFQQVGDRCSC